MDIFDILFWIFAGFATGTSLLVLVAVAFHFIVVRGHYCKLIARIFLEMPPFNGTQGEPLDGAEEVTVTTSDGVQLQGCYLRTPTARRGVILFGIEFRSNCWMCRHQCEFLLAAGYDIFSIEMRGQGTSGTAASYVPMQWVTDYELLDYRAAVAYLKARPDCPPEGIGFFGLSKGASAALFIATEDPFIRCCVTDGLFATLTTMVPYMKHWVHIYTTRPWLIRLIPNWYFHWIAKLTLGEIASLKKVHYPSLERVLGKLAPRPLLMIHGGGDKYIKPDMARALFEKANCPKDLWIVEKAKHNQALQVAGPEYHRRVLEFFEKHLPRTTANVPRDVVPQDVELTPREMSVAS